MLLRLMMEDAMSKVIEFHTRDLFPKKANSMTRTQCGKVIEFRLPLGKALAMQIRKPASREAHTKEGPIPIWTFCAEQAPFA